ncbi:uncharacterized protein LOC126755441 isoform X2 [Bactrocera neohumeralis]|uniref:uncharacterized protein LOC126755441 isoform X2 n=1 Tax=Bactrocera neohumeralis TaxID=98809 RepID=UPI0021666332|nr:uncharacterized protein LOC126755441 isoform X2 [Bactrocera neohumeralis]
MEEEINDERGTSDADLPIAIQRNVTNRQLNRKAFLIYPTLPKGKNIDREIKYIQKKFSAIRIDLKCHKMGLSKSKKRRLRRKRQERARLNKGTPDMNKVAANPVLVGSTESKNNGIKNELDVKINILAHREVNKNVSILYPNNSKQGSDTVSKSPNKLASEIIAETHKSNENKSIFSPNESEHEKDSRLSSRKRKKNEHPSKCANLFPTPSFKTAKENEMSAQSTTEAVCSSKINESFAHRNLNNELSTLKLAESKLFTKNANIFASSSSKSTNHNESIEKLKKTKDLEASKSKSETSSKKYKLVKLATKADIDPKYLFQPIKVAKLSAEHSMDTKIASQSKSKLASNNSKTTIENESIEKRKKTKHASKIKSKTSPKRYKPAKVAPIDVTEPKNLFQPIKVAKLSAEHNMDTKVTDQSKSKLASNNSKTPKIDNGLSAQKPQRTKRFSKRRRKISAKNSGVQTDLVIDKIKSHELFYYSIELTGNLNLLRTNDIFFMLNIQNSLPTKDWIFIKRKEIIKGKSEISFVFDRATLTSLEKMQFKASVLRSTVTFVEYVFKKAFLPNLYQPFDWLGEWSDFKTVLNKNEDIDY